MERSDKLRQMAQRCRNMAAAATIESTHDTLAGMAREFDDSAEEMEREHEREPSGPGAPASD